MLIVETIAKVRRAYFAHGKSIKAICRELGLSRKVVRKVIRSGETSFTYERAVQPGRSSGDGRRRSMNCWRRTRPSRPASSGFLRSCAGVVTEVATTPFAATPGGGARKFLQMCRHYLVNPVACTPASGWEKGQVGRARLSGVALL